MNNTKTVTIEVPVDAEVLINGKPYEEPKPEWKDWRELKEQTYTLFNTGSIMFSGPKKCLASFAQGNVFRTKSDALKESRRRALEAKWLIAIEKACFDHGEWAPNWSDESQIKFYFGYVSHHESATIYFYETEVCQFRSDAHHFPAEAEAELRAQFTDAQLRFIYTGEEEQCYGL